MGQGAGQPVGYPTLQPLLDPAARQRDDVGLLAHDLDPDDLELPADQPPPLTGGEVARERTVGMPLNDLMERTA